MVLKEHLNVIITLVIECCFFDESISIIAISQAKLYMMMFNNSRKHLRFALTSLFFQNYKILIIINYDFSKNE